MPSNTTPSTVIFYYVYVLESYRDHKRYIGYTSNLKQRLEDHAKGKTFSTKSRLPCKLIYFEGCTTQADAKRREQYLKPTQGRRFLGLRLQVYTRHTSAFGIGG